MDTQKLIARLRERAATQDACGCWSLDRAVADELERLAKDNAQYREVGVWEPNGLKFKTYARENLNGVAMFVREPK